MPIYEYQCERCGHALEAMQRMADPALRTCPKCGEDELRRLISNTSFVLKGSGWYVTDYKSGGGSASSSSKSDTSGASSDTGASKGESKSEPKAAAS